MGDDTDEAEGGIQRPARWSESRPGWKSEAHHPHVPGEHEVRVARCFHAPGRLQVVSSGPFNPEQERASTDLGIPLWQRLRAPFPDNDAQEAVSWMARTDDDKEQLSRQLGKSGNGGAEDRRRPGSGRGTEADKQR